MSDPLGTVLLDVHAGPEDRGPLRMISGERLAEYQEIDFTARSYLLHPSPETLAALRLAVFGK